MKSGSYHQAAVGLWMNMGSLYLGREMIPSISTHQSEQWKLGLNKEVNVHKIDESLLLEVISFN